MKRKFRQGLALLCALALLGCAGPALAAEDPGISVQLDGEELVFPDAVPEARDGRIFLPARAVFEALGAQVSYDAASQSATAVRGETAVTFTLGEAAAQVDRGGVSSTVYLDQAPYAKGNRMYVPIRFAAQAFGCAVGWDGDDRTAILIDTEKLLADTMAKYDFSYLEQALTWDRRYATGAWDVEMDFDFSLSASDADPETGEPVTIPLTLGGSAAGTMEDNARLDLAMELWMDLRTFLEAAYGEDYLTDPELTPPEALVLLDDLAEEGLLLDLRGDLEAGQFYFRLGGDFLETFLAEELPEVPADAWFLLDLKAMYEAEGMDYAQFLALLQTQMDLEVSYAALLLLSAAEPDDKDASYAELARAVDLAAQMLRDEAWAVSGNDRILHYALDMDGLSAAFTFTLTLDGAEASGLELVVTASAPDGGMSLTGTVDDQGNQETVLTMEMFGQLEMDLTASGRYTPAEAAPETQPPEGVTVIDLMEESL